jgi:hypothetical protein
MRLKPVAVGLVALTFGGGFAAACSNKEERSRREQGTPTGTNPNRATPKALPTGATTPGTATAPPVTETVGTLPRPTNETGKTVQANP